MSSPRDIVHCQASNQVAADPPDVAVIDIRMPPTYTNEGLLAAQRIRDDHPRVGTVVLSQHIEVDYALKLLTGTSDLVGYLLKDRTADIDDFISALDTVAGGGTVIEPTLVAEGNTDRGIAEQLYVTRKTVEAHIRSILNKLDLPADATANRRVHAVLTYFGHTGRSNPEPTPRRTEGTDVDESPRLMSRAP